MKKKYLVSNENNLEQLLKDGCTLGVDTRKGLLSSRFIAVNSFGNLFAFNDEETCKRLTK